MACLLTLSSIQRSLFLFLYSDPYYHDRFLLDSPDQLGIAFSKENMIVLMQEEVEESSDSSDNQ